MEYISYVVDNNLFDVRVADKKVTKLVELRKYWTGTYSWTHHGQQIAFLNDSFEDKIEIINADGTDRQAIWVARPLTFSQSPRLNKILSYVEDISSAVSDYNITDYEKGISFRLGKALATSVIYPGVGQSAVWSPDGNQIAFIPARAVCLSDSEAKNRRCLESTAHVERLLGLAWQPNVNN